MRRTDLAVLSAVLAGAVALPAAGEERILRFHSEITVHADASLTVTETIQVWAERSKIKRGIYRDFPIRYRGRGMSSVVVPLEILAVTRDGKAESCHTESKGKYKRIYMGKKDVFLNPGEHTYRLTYKTARQVGFFREHDELYWNVTGNEWEFPIERASAAVTLPRGVPREKIGREGYTGPEGAKGKDYRAWVDEQTGRVCFQTTGPLGPKEGLTLVATWPKGFVQEPSTVQELAWFFLDNGVVAISALGLLVVFGYYLLTWARVGRDPPRGGIIPMFEAPGGLSPPATRYILNMGFDKKCPTAGMIDLAVKGHLTITEDDGDYTIEKNPEADSSQVPAEERKFIDRLFSTHQRLDLDNEHHVTFSKAVKKMKKALSKAYENRYFYSNTRFFAVGAALSVLALVGAGSTAALAGGPEIAFLMVWLSGWSVGVFFLVRQVIRQWRAARGQGLEGVARKGGALFITFFAVPFVAAEIAVLCFLSWMASIWLAPILLAIAVINVVFYQLLKRPTPEGRKVMDAIEGLKMYLGTAEKDAMDYARKVHRTVQEFEKFLPYALALDVENAWAEQFSDVLDKAAASGHEPSWYHGAAWSAVGAAGLAGAIGSSFTSALSSASTAPGSSSGSGGGGSSGGGGGGGGGGGW